MQVALTWIIAGTSSSHIASYSGQNVRSDVTGPFHQPPDGSGFRLHPTNPISSDTATQLGDRVPDRRLRITWRLRELTYGREPIGVQVADAADQVVAVLRPELRRVGVADVVTHPRRPRREDAEVDPALALETELVRFETLSKLVVGDVDRTELADVVRIVDQRRLLSVAVLAQLRRRRRVVPMAVDDHAAPLSSTSAMSVFPSIADSLPY